MFVFSSQRNYSIEGMRNGRDYRQLTHINEIIVDRVIMVKAQGVRCNEDKAVASLLLTARTSLSMLATSAFVH